MEKLSGSMFENVTERYGNMAELFSSFLEASIGLLTPNLALTFSVIGVLAVSHTYLDMVDAS